MSRHARNRAVVRFAGAVALAFGILTIVAGGRALFGDEAARAAVGDAVPFVLWFNFMAGFAYAVAGLGLLFVSRWAAWLSAGIAAATVLVFVAFGVHALVGGAYELRTVGAMTFRSLLWMLIAIVALRAVAPAPGRQRGVRMPAP
jgi:hypothetical protein